MIRTDAADADSAPDEAARRFVRVDAGEPGADAELARWLAEHPANEHALLRVELAAALGRRLATDPGSVLHAEAAQAARLGPRRRGSARAAAWGGALAAALLLAMLILPDSAPRPGARELAPLRAAGLVTIDAPSNPVSVLPTGVVVDASAVAVLPFATAGDTTLAVGLEGDVVASLRTVPGLYVIAEEAVRPYAASQLGPAEIGGQLGARGIVDAAVDLVGGRLYVSAQLRDAATGATLWRTDVDRPVDELSAVRYEIAESIATTMLDAGLREQAARASRSSAPLSASKPLPQ